MSCGWTGDPEHRGLDRACRVADAWSEYVTVRGTLNHVADRVQSLALAEPATTDIARTTK